MPSYRLRDWERIKTLGRYTHQLKDMGGTQQRLKTECSHVQTSGQEEGEEVGRLTQQLVDVGEPGSVWRLLNRERMKRSADSLSNSKTWRKPGGNLRLSIASYKLQ